MSQKETFPPAYKVIPHPNGPTRITTDVQLGTTGLSQLVLLSPSFDPADGLFAPAEALNNTTVQFLWGIAEDRGRVYRILAPGEDAEAKQRIENTVGYLRRIINAWGNPVEFEEIFTLPMPYTTTEQAKIQP